MGRMSKNVENFMRTLDERRLSQIREEKGRNFADELYVFGDLGCGRLRRISDDFVILGDRRKSRSLAGSPLFSALSFTPDERRGFYAALDGGEEFAIISCGGKTAILYRRLFRSYRVGVISLTRYSAETAVAASAEEYGHIFEDARFYAEPSGRTARCDVSGFISDYLGFRDRMLSACGAAGRDMGEMMAAVSELVDCETVYKGGDLHISEHIDRDTTAAILLCLLSVIRAVSADRCAYIGVSDHGGEAVINISFKPSGDHTPQRGVYMEFCRSFSELHGIPFSFGDREGMLRFSFIPMRIDPSMCGLKASVEFNLSFDDFGQDFHDAR